MQKKLAVCINVYNGENTIGEVIESLLRQTEKEFYAFIIDNGSTDDTIKVCDQNMAAITFSGIEWPDIYVFRAEEHKEGLIPFLERILNILSKRIKEEVRSEITSLYFVNQRRPLQPEEVEQEYNERNIS